MTLGKVMGPMHLRGAGLLGNQECLLVSVQEHPVAAVNRAGAKPGERVLLVMGPAAAGLCMEAPVDAVIVAVVEEDSAGSGVPRRAADKSAEDTFRDAGWV